MSARLAATIGVALALVACSSGGGDAGTAASMETAVEARGVETSAEPPSSTAAPGDTTAATAAAGTEVAAHEAPRTACDGLAPDDAGTDEGASGGPPLTVAVWHYLHDRAADELAASVSEYEDAHAGVHVVLVPFASMRDELDTWTATDPADRPDVLIASDDYIGSLAGSPDLLPLDACLDDGGELLPAVEQTYTIDGHLVAAPFLVSTPVLFFDAGAFERAGLDPAVPPESFTELRTALEALVSSGVAPAGIALETGGQSGGSWYVEQWLARRGIDSLVADNGRSARAAATTVNWSSPEAIDGIEFLAGLVADGLATVVEDTSGSADLLRIVSTDPAAMAVQSSASIGEVLDVLDQGAFGGIELGVGPLPGPGHGGLVGGAALWVAAGHDDGRRSIAVDLIRHLTSTAAQAELASRTGYVPVRSASLDDPVLLQAVADRPQLLVAIDQIRDMPTDPANLVPVSPVRTELRTLLGSAVTAVLVGGADPRDALELATEGAEGLLAGT